MRVVLEGCCQFVRTSHRKVSIPFIVPGQTVFCLCPWEGDRTDFVCVEGVEYLFDEWNVPRFLFLIDELAHPAKARSSNEGCTLETVLTRDPLVSLNLDTFAVTNAPDNSFF